MPASSKKTRRNTVNRSVAFDKSLVLVLAFLLLFGLVVIYSSTVIHSQNIFHNPYRFVLLQFGWIILGLMGFFFFYRLDYTRIDLISYIFMVASVFFLVLTAIAGILPCSTNIPFIPCINDANRWLIINPPPFPKIPIIGEMGFQPSEFAKLALILYLSVKLPNVIKKGGDAFFVYLVATGVSSGLVILQPNMSTAIIIFFIGTVLYFSSGASIKPLLVLLPALMVVGFLFIIMSPYRKDRLMTFLNKDSQKEELSSGYHIKQVSIALGSGGLFGVGFGQSKQKYYLPEVASDSIFAIIGEEFGFAGCLVIISVFSFLIYKGFEIAKNSSDPTRRLLAVGITSWLALQFTIHIAANSSLIPYTGVPIPLISYGGSSMLFSMTALGVLVGISKSE